MRRYLAFEAEFVPGPALRVGRGEVGRTTVRPLEVSLRLDDRLLARVPFPETPPWRVRFEPPVEIPWKASERTTFFLTASVVGYPEGSDSPLFADTVRLAWHPSLALDRIEVADEPVEERAAENARRILSAFVAPLPAPAGETTVLHLSVSAGEAATLHLGLAWGNDTPTLQPATLPAREGPDDFRVPLPIPRDASASGGRLVVALGGDTRTIPLPVRPRPAPPPPPPPRLAIHADPFDRPATAFPGDPVVADVTISVSEEDGTAGRRGDTVARRGRLSAVARAVDFAETLAEVSQAIDLAPGETAHVVLGPFPAPPGLLRIEARFTSDDTTVRTPREFDVDPRLPNFDPFAETVLVPRVEDAEVRAGLLSLLPAAVPLLPAAVPLRPGGRATLRFDVASLFEEAAGEGRLVFARAYPELRRDTVEAVPLAETVVVRLQNRSRRTVHLPPPRLVVPYAPPRPPRVRAVHLHYASPHEDLGGTAAWWSGTAAWWSGTAAWWSGTAAWWRRIEVVLENPDRFRPPVVHLVEAAGETREVFLARGETKVVAFDVTADRDGRHALPLLVDGKVDTTITFFVSYDPPPPVRFSAFRVATPAGPGVLYRIEIPGDGPEALHDLRLVGEAGTAREIPLLPRGEEGWVLLPDTAARLEHPPGRAVAKAAAPEALPAAPEALPAALIARRLGPETFVAGAPNAAAVFVVVDSPPAHVVLRWVVDGVLTAVAEVDLPPDADAALVPVLYRPNAPGRSNVLLIAASGEARYAAEETIRVSPNGDTPNGDTPNAGTPTPWQSGFRKIAFYRRAGGSGRRTGDSGLGDDAGEEPLLPLDLAFRVTSTRLRIEAAANETGPRGGTLRREAAAALASEALATVGWASNAELSIGAGADDLDRLAEVARAARDLSQAPRPVGATELERLHATWAETLGRLLHGRPLDVDNLGRFAPRSAHGTRRGGG